MSGKRTSSLDLTSLEPQADQGKRGWLPVLGGSRTSEEKPSKTAEFFCLLQNFQYVSESGSNEERLCMLLAKKGLLHAHETHRELSPETCGRHMWCWNRSSHFSQALIVHMLKVGLFQKSLKSERHILILISETQRS